VVITALKNKAKQDGNVRKGCHFGFGGKRSPFWADRIRGKRITEESITKW